MVRVKVALVVAAMVDAVMVSTPALVPAVKLVWVIPCESVLGAVVNEPTIVPKNETSAFAIGMPDSSSTWTTRGFGAAVVIDTVWESPETAFTVEDDPGEVVPEDLQADWAARRN